ncbi:MAG: hypothetical protein IPM29_12850 [Planctomycetes bacterium]|nr:hypothetical protein [Planctomycetota bacterium]
MLRLLALCAATLAPRGAAQDVAELQVHVTAVAGRSVYLDRGRSDGLEPGQEVELLPPGGTPVPATIREASTSSARAEIPPGRELPPIGTPGTARVARRAAGDPARSAPRRAAVPDHPPWQATPLEHDPDDPLLAPAFGGGPARRPTRWDGRAFMQLLYSRDDGDGRANEYLLARLGTRLGVFNPFGLGGSLSFDGELTRRASDLLDDGSDATDRGRIDRLSYAHGDDEARDVRFEAGRFVSRFAPELGLLDGVEVARRLGSSWRVGAGAGALPLPFPARQTGEDWGAFAFAQWVGGGNTRASWTGGFQKTWHHGTPDRDLLFTRFDWSPAERLRFDGSAKVDLYGSGDDLKSTGPELTEAWLSSSWRPNDRVRVGVTASRYRWAQLRRDELYFADPELIRRAGVLRAGPRVDVDLADDVRAWARADWWQDQDDQGLGGELGVEARDALAAGLDVSAALFRVDGSFQDGPGIRLRAAQRIGAHRVELRYELVSWSTAGLPAGDETFEQHRVGASLDLVPADAVSLQIDAELTFGDGQDALFLGTYAQFRF